ncbi:MAG: hypothetical protein BWY72_02366 [Bacteroidetes bacterium ADurb.Bin416]|nr:MAG: hypothetical protein BWY72_02366 [Bacteroidetes bacterium ADurb.Bin416]
MSVLLSPFVGHHIEAARQCNDKFLALLVGMTTSYLTTGHVVHQKSTGNFEGYITQLFNHRQIASRIGYSLQIDALDVHIGSWLVLFFRNNCSICVGYDLCMLISLFYYTRSHVLKPLTA